MYDLLIITSMLYVTLFVHAFLIILFDYPKDVVSDNEKQINYDTDEQHGEEFESEDTSSEEIEGVVVNVGGA